MPERAAPGVSFPKNDCLIDARRIARAGDLVFARWLSLCEGRKVNHSLRMQQSPAAQGLFPISRAAGRLVHLEPVHRAA
jgi:hypothetical protein